MDKKEFIIEFLFTQHKDEPCTKRILNELADEFSLSEEDITELRAIWIKYQVEYYGEQIKPTYMDSYINYKNISRLVRARRYQKKKHQGLK